MKLRDALARNISVEFERDTDKRVSTFVTVHVRLSNGKPNGKYQVVIKKFLEPEQLPIDCEDFVDLCSKLHPGEAESDEWFAL